MAKINKVKLSTAFLVLTLASGFGAGFYVNTLSELAADGASVAEMIGTGFVAAGFAITGALCVAGSVFAEKVENLQPAQQAA